MKRGLLVLFLLLICVGFVSSESSMGLSYEGVDYTIELITASDTSATIKVTDSLGNSDVKEVSPEQDVLPYEINDIGGLKIILMNANEQLFEPLMLEATLWIGLDNYFCMSGCETTKSFFIDETNYVVEFITASDTSATITLNGITKEISPEQGGTINYVAQSNNVEGLQIILVEADEQPVEPMLEANLTFYYEKSLSITADLEENETCIEDWTCTTWSSCINNQQTRTCTDSNNCETTNDKPSVSQDCESNACVENWFCGPWEDCIDGLMIRTCTDSNECGTTINKPTISKTCELNNSEENNSNQNTIQNRFYIKNKEVNMEINRISSGNNSVSSDLEIVGEGAKIYVQTSNGNREIKILPEEAIESVTKIEYLGNISIVEKEGVAVYKVEGKKKARFLLIFPLFADVKQYVNVEDGSVVSTEKPWWSFLAIGV